MDTTLAMKFCHKALAALSGAISNTTQITTTTISSSSSVPELITVDDSTDEQQVDDSTDEQQDEGVVFSFCAVHCLKKLRNYLWLNHLN